MPQLLLVDTRVRQFEAVTCAVAPSVTAVTFDWSSDSLATILDKLRSLSIQSFDNMGIVQDANEFMMQYRLVESQVPADMRDTALTTWEPLLAFFGALKTEFGVKTVDFVSCNLYSVPHFAETMTALEARLGMDLRASKDRTGNLVAGGNWVQESDGVDIKGLYFTDAIEAYKEVLYTTPWKPSNMMVKADGSNKDWAMVSATKPTLDTRLPVNVEYTLSSSSSNTITPDNYIAIASTHAAFAALKADGNIVTWAASNGEYMGSIAAAPTYTGYTAIASTYGAFAALKANGSIVAWAAFDGSFVSSASIEDTPTDTGYTAIASTINSFAALKANGSIVTWGDFAYGASVSGGVPADTGYTAIASTYGAFAALKANGSIVAWGESAHGGSGAPTDTGYTAIVSTGRAFAALKANGSIVAWGDSAYGGSDAPTDTGYTAIASTERAFAALKANGSIVAWGNPYYGGGGSGKPIDTGYTAIASTASAFAAMKDNGNIVTWGNYGYSGSGYTAIASTEIAFVALKYDGSITVLGNSSSWVPTGTGYTAIASSARDFVAVKPIIPVMFINGQPVRSNRNININVYDSNPTIVATHIDTNYTVTISDHTNLSIGTNIVTVTATYGLITEIYTVNVTYLNEFPEPEYYYDVGATHYEVNSSYDGHRSLGASAVFNTTVSNEISRVEVYIYKKNVQGEDTFIGSILMEEPWPLSANERKWFNQISVPNVTTGTAKFEIRIIPKVSSNRPMKTIVTENVVLDPISLQLSIDGPGSILVTPSIPPSLASRQQTLKFPNFSSNIRSSASSFIFSSSTSTNEYWTISGADGSSPYTIDRLPISNTPHSIQITIHSDNANPVTYYSTGVPIPMSNSYTITDMAAFTVTDINTTLAVPATVENFSLQQLTALDLSTVESAMTSFTVTDRLAINDVLRNKIPAKITIALNDSASSVTKAVIDAAMKLLSTAAIAGNQTIPAFTVAGANMLLMNAGAPASVNTVLLSAMPPGAQGPRACNLTDTQLTTLSSGGRIYIGGDVGDTVVLRSETDVTKTVTISFEEEGVIIVDGTARAIGDSVVTSLGRLYLLFGGSLQAMLGSTVLPPPLLSSSGAHNNGDISVQWLATTDAASYGLQISADAGTTWSSEVTTTGLSYRFGNLTAGSAYKFRIRSIPINGSALTASEYVETASRISMAAPGAPTLSASANGLNVDLVLTPPSTGGAVTGYEVQVKKSNTVVAFNSAAVGFTYDSVGISGTIAYTGTDAATYTLTGIPADGTAYTIQVRANNEFQSGYAYATVTTSSISSVVTTTVISTYNASQIASVAPSMSAMTLEQLAALPAEPLIQAAAAPAAPVVAAVTNAVAAAVATKLSAAVVTEGAAKANVDAALKRASAAQAASSASATVTATTVSNANLKHINAAGLAATDAIVASALPPRSGNAPVDCVLTSAQESLIRAGGQFYIAGGMGDKLRFVSSDSTKAALFEFPGTGQIKVDGIDRVIGAEVVTAFGSIRLLFSGSAGGQGVVTNAGSGPICFLADAPVLTPTGYRPISAIAVGDLVRTAAGRDVRVKRAFAKEYSAGPSVNPFVIPKGSFGALRALPISPNHEVMVVGQGMVKAKELGVKRMKMTDSFTYYNLELEDWVRDNLVVAGVECESLAPAERIVMTKAEFSRFVRTRYGPVAAARLRTVCFEEADGHVSMPKL